MGGELRIGRILVSTGANGPGTRLVIWFQGCPFCCKGCFNPEFHDTEGGSLMSRSELFNRIVCQPDIEGVTFTGGEPLLQASSLIPLAQAIKGAGLTIVCYTGYTLEQIKVGIPPSARHLVPYLDILIDGLFEEKEKAPLLWRGSRNQRVHFLTNRYEHLAEQANQEGRREAEVLVGPDSIAMTGIFDIEFWERLKAKLSGHNNER